MIRFLLVLVLVVISFSASAGGILSNEKYDADFRIWSSVYLPGRDWRLLKAQCWQESRLQPLAVSSANARGICQFVPTTFNEVVNQTGFSGSPWDAELGIQFSAYYMASQIKFWNKISEVKSRDTHAIASYNAGAGNINKSWKLCGSSSTQSWDKTKTCLVKVTGRHHKETIGYVEAINKFYLMLIMGL